MYFTDDNEENKIKLSDAYKIKLIQKEGLDLFIKKNADYGDAYKRSVRNKRYVHGLHMSTNGSPPPWQQSKLP